MRTGHLLDSPSAVGLLASGVAAAPLSYPPVDLSAYSQLVQHMASLYSCDPAAVAASLATITSSTSPSGSHLPLALTAPHALTTVALASAALSGSSQAAHLSSPVSTSSLSNVEKQEHSTISSTFLQEAQNLVKSVDNDNHSKRIKTEDCSPKSISTKSYQSSYQMIQEKPKKTKANGNKALNNNNTYLHDNDGALDLSTQGLRSLYSSYKRISLDNVKQKVVEDLWVENDSVLSWTDSKVAAYNPAQKLFMCVDCECVGFLSRVAEHWLGAHANLRVFRCPRCPYTSAWSRCVKMHLTRQHNEQCADTTMWKENSTLLEVTRLMQELRTKVETRIDAASTLSDKRFYCPHCPYATDRRDLYTRHENIHKDDKPFHCYLCYKQFNRADHVKKHFVRMHPDTPYDIAKIRKTPGGRGRGGSPATHESTPPPGSTPIQTPPLHSFCAVPSIDASTPLAMPLSLATSTKIRRSVSPLPLTIQNLRAHNIAMSAHHPPSPSSPDITIDVVTPDPPLHASSSGKNTFTALTRERHDLSETASVTITKCSPVPPPSPPSISIQPAISTHVVIPKISPKRKSPEPVQITPVLSEVTETPRAKKRTDKSFLCPYCQWSGSDNWCLKRHMNTHIKPFACTMCEYKAARAERLSTHVLKVHNKRICNKCSFMADTQEKLLEHSREEHHNNPYSRRHTCGICALTLDSQSSLQNHLQTAHVPSKKVESPKPTVSTPSPVAVSNLPQHVQKETHNLSVSNLDEEPSPLSCPVMDCSEKFVDPILLTTHLERVHGNEEVARCPHCSFCLTNDEFAKDHWLTHHQDVCAVCVLVFTTVYGAQLWKKVHMKASNQESPLDAIVTGLNKKRSAPNSESECSGGSELDRCDSLSTDSDQQESDAERHCKRSRKQSCPKKVVAHLEDNRDENEQEADKQRCLRMDLKRNKHFKCLKCTTKPVFATFSRLRTHNRRRHRVQRKQGSNNTKVSVLHKNIDN